MKSRRSACDEAGSEKDDHCGTPAIHSVGHMYPRCHSIMKKGIGSRFLSPSKLSCVEIESEGVDGGP